MEDTSARQKASVQRRNEAPPAITSETDAQFRRRCANLLRLARDAAHFCSGWAHTYRLSIVVASMLRHALDIAAARFGEGAPERSAAASLLRAADEADPDQVAEQIGDLVERLLRDAKVAGKRVTARGGASVVAPQRNASSSGAVYILS